MEDQLTLFNTEHYARTESNYHPDWADDIEGDDWEPTPTTSRGVHSLTPPDVPVSELNCQTCTHFDGDRFCKKFNIRFKEGESLFTTSECFHHHSLTPPVSEYKLANHSLTLSGCINIYKAAGKATGDNRYFRYSWRESGRVKHRHIPGGNVRSPLAKSRAAEVERAIATGADSQKVCQLIHSFTRQLK